MNAAVLRAVIAGWADPARVELDALDRALCGRRGPKAGLTLRALAITIVCLLVEQRPAHLKAAWRALSNADAECLGLLGIDKTPTYRQVCLVVERLRRHVDGDEPSARSERVQRLLDMLVPASAGGDDGTTTWAVDTTLFDAWCRWVKKTENCSDPDASWRKIDRPGSSAKTYLGYAAVAAVRTDGNGSEVCDRLAVIPANQDDAEPAVNLCLAVREAGLGLERVVADRGFTQKPDRFQTRLRNAGVHVTFDLKSDDLGVNGTFKGAVVIDGWLYAPGIPERLRRIERPGPNASKEQHDEFAARVSERMRWAFRPHRKPDPDRARVASPVDRGHIRCTSIPGRQTTDPAAPTCRKKHPSDLACGMRTTYFPADAAPRTYQWPAWETKGWKHIYNKRSAVERFFGHLQSDACAGFRKGRFQVRGLAKVAFVTGLAVVATNLKLRKVV